MRYDLERLSQLSIKDVLEALGARPSHNGRVFHCFNVNAHKDNDNNASMSIYERTNSCHCFTCGISGTPVNIAKHKFGGDFKEACEFLHATFKIATLDNNPVRQVKVQSVQKPK